MYRSRCLPFLIIALLLLTACRAGNTVSADIPAPAGAVDLPPAENLDLDQPFQGPGVIFQWAVEAEASSEFAAPDWGAEKATGAPDSPGCGDYQYAWASAASDAIDTLTLRFAEKVFPQQIVIYQSFNPDQVVKVEVLDEQSGAYYAVLQKNPLQVDRPCPYELSVPVSGIDFATKTIRITLDQSQLGLGWNEIDAVQLIGSVAQPTD